MSKERMNDSDGVFLETSSELLEREKDIIENIEIPDLLDVQKESYEEFLQKDVYPEKREVKGIEEVLRKIFPIESSNGNLILEYVNYTIESPVNSIEECIENGLTYDGKLKIKIRLIVRNNETRKNVPIKEQEVYIGSIPLMTDSGSFIINGIERVIVNQLLRCPGVYFKEEEMGEQKTSYSAKIYPSRGLWIEFHVDSHNCLMIFLGRKKVIGTVFLKALGLTKEDIVKEFYGSEGKIPENSILRQTLLRDTTITREDALKEIYKELRPGFPPIIKEAESFFNSLFFSNETYNLSEPGRAQINRKLGLNLNQLHLTKEDIIAIIKYLLNLTEKGEGTTDDIDHLGNKRVRTTGEIVKEHLFEGLLRMRKYCEEKMKIIPLEEIEKEITPQDFINGKVLMTVLNDFFARNQLSQFLEKINPLSEITHKRRVTAVGEGGIKERKRAGFEVRDVHYTHFGKICPIETPEGANIGLIGSLTVHSKIGDLGFILTPYFKVENGKVTDKVEYLSANDEENFKIAPPDVDIDPKTKEIKKEQVTVRVKDGLFEDVSRNEVDYIGVSPIQIVSVSASLIPFLEHDDSNRALMGSNMQRQGVPLIKNQAPLVKTGMEKFVIRDSKSVIKAKNSGIIKYVDADKIIVERNKKGIFPWEKEDIYHLKKFNRTNQDTCFHQRPVVDVGNKVEKGQIISDGPATSKEGELALGKNLLVAFMPWHGYNYEDAIILNERMVKEDVFTSIHISEFPVEARETELGPEEITADLPNVPEGRLRNLDENGIIRVGAEVEADDILVGKITPRGESELTPEEKLLRVIFGEKAKDVQNTSLKVPPGIKGVVVNVKKYERTESLTLSSIQKRVEAINSKINELKIPSGKKQELKNKFEEVQKHLKDRDIDKIRQNFKDLENSVLIEEVNVKYKEKEKIIKEIIKEQIEKTLKLNNIKAKVTTTKETWNKVVEKIQDEKIKGQLQKLIEIGNREIKNLKKELRDKENKIRKGPELEMDVISKIVVEIAVKKKISVGDKMSGRHGNKGVISKILPEEDMPFTEDGTPVDIILNPLGVPSRMNIGQILETHLGIALKTLGYSTITPIFKSIKESEIKELLEKSGLSGDGKMTLYDGQTGEKFSQPITVGYIYMMKLIHLADEKIHARATGSYSLITQQPLGGRSQFGGQRLGEMEVWALEGYGAAHTLKEMLTVKSDDTEGRKQVYESIAKGIDFKSNNTPESFNVLKRELQGLGFDMRVEKRNVDGKSKEVVTIKVASPTVMRSWSHGEVKKAETLNYRTLRPEREGLFCERIFGPTKDYECACGKYKKLRYKGIICDRCGVEVTTKRVRRERMGHIELATPVSYVWLFKSSSNWMGMLLDLSQSELEMVLYYARYIVIDPGKTDLTKKQLLTESEYYEYIEKHGNVFRAEIGAEAIYHLLKEIDLPSLEEQIKQSLGKMKKSERETKRKLIKKLRMIQGLLKTNTKPEYLITNIIPVIPPDLRPLLPLDGGKFVASDLNDLYQRVINRNNRLKKLIKLQAPDIIIRNEKRMLQESVDALMDNGKHGAAVLGKGRRPLKSLADALRGKQGRFRQNLLGKRVDYSGRAVIVVGSELKLNECGIPKEMALELFSPFVLRELRKKEYFHTLGSAKRAIRENKEEVWGILEKVSKHHPVLLNRQPTLHRLSIQAFEPRLIEGNVLKLHPLVCPAFNADFDGDTMSIHIPLLPETILEAELLMKATTHILSPASGKPIVSPSRDIAMGCFYLTFISDESEYPEDERKCISNFEECKFLYDNGIIELHRPIRVRDETGNVITTTVGRILFNEILPIGLPFKNEEFEVKKLEVLIKEIFNKFGYEQTVKVLDGLKEIGFYYSTTGGITIGIDDLKTPERKKDIVDRAKKEAEKVNRNYKKGIITAEERYNRIVDIWTSTTNVVCDYLMDTIEKDRGIKPFRINPIYLMVTSGARGNKNQVNQLMGMRGLMIRPTKKVTGGIGEIVETPVISNFKEGLTLLEYFTSIHGGRKGLVDTALKTSDAGYLSRRLVDVAHSIMVTEEDCGTLEGILIGPLVEEDEVIIPLEERIIGRVAVDNVVDIVTDEEIVKSGEVIDEEKARRIVEAGIQRIRIRSVLTCKAEKGVCAKCYGWDLSREIIVNIGEAVGVVAAQSIGEPGTQLTLRTFHTGGTASRGIGSSQIIAKKDGILKYEDNLKVVTSKDNKIVVVHREGNLKIVDERGREVEKYTLPVGSVIEFPEGSKVKGGQLIASWNPYSTPVITDKEGIIKYEDIEIGKTVNKENLVIPHKEDKDPRIILKDEKGNIIERYPIPEGMRIVVKEGEKVYPGDIISEKVHTAARAQDITAGLPRVSELFEARIPKNPAVLSEIDGEVEILSSEKGMRKIKVKNEETQTEKIYIIPTGKHLLVGDGDYVIAGRKLTDGPVVLQDILKIQGEKKVQEYLLNEIQKVYRVEGVTISDKHIEIIVRQMLSKVRVEETGDTYLLEGEEISRVEIQKINEALPKGKKPATYKALVLGITRVALSSSSFISASSFQETMKVLTNSAILGAEDYLEGLKENVILGRLIPAGTGRFTKEVSKEEFEFVEVQK